jgi:hypothetical protein
MLLCQNFEKVDLFLTWGGGTEFVVAWVHLDLHQPWLKVDMMIHIFQGLFREMTAHKYYIYPNGTQLSI